MHKSTGMKAAAWLLALGLLGGSVLAQDPVVDSTKIWKKSMTADLTATQTAYSNSWAGGEAGAFSWVGNLNGFAEKNLSPKFNLRSQLKLSFGQTTTQDEESKDWSKPKKSTDLIDWETVGRFLLNEFVDPYVAFRIESQFYDGSVPAKKLYFSPMKLTESAGVAHRFYERENDHVTTRLGAAVQEVITQSIIDLATLETESTTSTSAGIESVSDALITFNDKLQYQSKLTLFKALYNSTKDDFVGTPQEDNWKAVDAKWENTVTARLTKIIAVSLFTDIRYDKDIIDKVQIKETLGIGFLFKLM